MLHSGKIDNLQKHLWLDWNNVVSLPRDWSLFLMFYFEPTYRNYDEDFIKVYGIEGSITKQFTDQMSLSLYVGTGKSRVTRTYMADAVQTYRTATPVLFVSLSFNWNFIGGKEVSVRRERTRQSYQSWQPE